MKGLIEKKMDESFPYPNLTYYSCGDLGRRNPVALKVKSEDMRQWLLNVPKDKVLSLDLETTGLNPRDNDEILQISICDGNGSTLLNSYVRPEKRRRWPNAERIHGITWQMVKDSPTLKEMGGQIKEILGGCTLLIGYNIRTFDLEFLKAGHVWPPSGMKVYDLIYDCSVIHGTWSDKYHNYTYISLAKVAQWYGVKYEAHDALEDAVATTMVFYGMLDSYLMKKAIEERKGTAAKPTTTVSVPKPAPTVTKRPTVVDKPATKKRQTLREWVENPQQPDMEETARVLVAFAKWLLIAAAVSVALLIIIATL
jgi:DNA polymerase-3 subunit epsilon